jgi:hypothetical protein
MTVTWNISDISGSRPKKFDKSSLKPQWISLCLYAARQKHESTEMYKHEIERELGKFGAKCKWDLSGNIIFPDEEKLSLFLLSWS